MNNIPLSKKNYNIELKNIIQIAKFNNFPINKIQILNNQIKNKIKFRKITTLKKDNQLSKQYYKMTYFGQISDKIKKTFNKFNIHIAQSVPKKNTQLLKNMHREIEKDSESGIYKLTCKCNAVYIGKTTRKFKQRIYEHHHAFLYNIPERSNFSAHILHPTHEVIPFTNNYEIIKIIHEKKKILIWEEIEILKYKLKYKIINEYLPNTHNPLYKLLGHFAELYNLKPIDNNIQTIKFHSPRKKKSQKHNTNYVITK